MLSFQVLGLHLPVLLWGGGLGQGWLLKASLASPLPSWEKQPLLVSRDLTHCCGDMLSPPGPPTGLSHATWGGGDHTDAPEGYCGSAYLGLVQEPPDNPCLVTMTLSD